MGASLSQSKYLAFLDADGEWAPNKLEEQLNYMRVEPTIRATSGYYFLQESESIRLIKSSFSYKYLRNWAYGLVPGPALNSTLLIEKDFFHLIGGYDKSLFNFAEDLDSAFKICSSDILHVIKKPLAEIFQHENQQHRRTELQINAINAVG